VQLLNYLELLDNTQNRNIYKFFLKRKNSEKMMKKLQAAMEYLMTYGWAILIIALALGVLYSLGVLNPGRLKPVMCMLPAPFSCQIGGFTTGGKLNITLSQGSGQTITLLGVACIDNQHVSSSNGLPDSNCNTGGNSTCWTAIVSGTNAVPSSTLASGSTISVYNIQCYPAGNGPFPTSTIGSSFGGTLILKYTMGGNTYYTSGSINAQVNKP
jgi:hypothetical protein